MKLSIIILLMTIPTICLGSFVDFNNNIEDNGIEVAVQKSLEVGISPEDIIGYGIDIEGLNIQGVLKALYCEGADGDDIKNGADVYGIPEMIVLSAFDQSVVECGDAVADSQAYTPIGITFFGLPQKSTVPNTRTASPSTF